MRLSDDIVITGNRAICRSYAKINLTLDVLGKREDGYHDVEMIMQTVNLSDLLILDLTKDDIIIRSNCEYLPTNEKNIAYKAAQLFFNETGIKSGIKIKINKNIPVAAGLAGGSGNAGAVLLALNKLFGNPLEDDRLLQLGLQLGADVPFCMEGGTCRCGGIGEKLTRISGMKPFNVLLVKPPVSVSTAAIYSQIDDEVIDLHPDNDSMTKAIECSDLAAISKGLCNVMEPVTQKLCPLVKGIKEKMLLNGASGALMSGSGPTVFGLFEDYKSAKASADSFAFQFKDVYLCNILV